MLKNSLKNTLKAAALAVLAACSVQALAAEFSAGLRSLDVPYHGGKFEASVWYPTRATEKLQSFGPYNPQVALGASVAAATAGAAERGRFPVVLVSHGTGGNALNQHTQAVALARAGFVVVSFSHPGDNYQDRSLVADPRFLSERPRQLSYALDALLADPDWKDRVDAARVGALGHSAGGYSVAALVGAVPDGARLAAHCSSAKDDPSCGLRDPKMFVVPSNKAPLKLPDSVKPESDLRDPRIRAALLMAPFAAAIRPGSLKNSTASILLIGAEHDEVLTAKYHFDYLRGELPEGTGRVASRVAAGAGHFAFIAPFVPEWKSRMGPIAMDPQGFDRAALHPALAAETVAFFEQALRP